MVTALTGEGRSTQPYLVVSTDTHAGPSLKRDLRTYCPRQHLDDFDRFAEEAGARADDIVERLDAKNQLELTSPLLAEALERTKSCPGQANMDARLKDMDADGVAAEIIFAGGANGEVLPFIGFGADAGIEACSPELRAIGCHIWNAWLADFVSTQPHRHVGVMQVPIWDVEAAITEMRWAYDAGLRAVNFPAPRRDFPSYNDTVYDPFWSACEELGLPLETHSAGGEIPLGLDGFGGVCIYRSETHWLGRRGLWQLIFGGVFEKHPRLKLVFTEQRVVWVKETLRELDSVHEQAIRDGRVDVVPKRPSEYWATNCFLGGSFLAPFEVALHSDVGDENLMWGSDYPHPEGTWPRTPLAMRNTFALSPEALTRKILGLNAVEVFNLDLRKLELDAERVGPTPSDIAVPLQPEEVPAFPGSAFREHGSYS